MESREDREHARLCMPVLFSEAPLPPLLLVPTSFTRLCIGCKVPPARYPQLCGMDVGRQVVLVPELVAVAVAVPAVAVLVLIICNPVGSVFFFILFFVFFL